MKIRFNGLVIGLCAMAVFGWNFWGTSIYWLDEVKNAWCAHEMVQRGNLAVPYFNGEYHDKPGLPYFFMQAAYFLFDMNAFSARFFSVLCGVGMVLIVYFFTRHYWHARAAVWASFILIASLQMGMQFKMATPDPFLLFFLTAAFTAFYHAWLGRRKKYLYIFYACIGFAFFAKGPVAVALPGLAIVVYLIFQRQFTGLALRWILNPIGIVIFIAIGCTWYIMAGLSTQGDWLEYFFITHNLSRYANTFEGHRGFPLDTVVVLFAGLLPLSVFLPQACWAAWQGRKTQPLLVYCLVIMVVFCAFFLFSKTMLPSYPAPAMPFAAIVLGVWISNRIKEPVRQRPVVSIIVLFLVSMALVVGGYLAMQQEEAVRHLAIPLAVTLALLPLAVLFSFVRWRAAIDQAAGLLLVAFIVVQLIIFGWLMPEADRQNPVVRSVPQIKRAGVPVAYFKRINPAFVFQLEQNIPKLSDAADVNAFVEQHGEVIIISTTKIWQRENLPGFTTIFQGKDLFETSGVIVLTNRPRP
jgi:4-amino-4-deoxy-L-arabinose transferase-like glycosyltransferase